MADRIPVERVAPGRYTLALEEGERQVLASLISQLEELLDEGEASADPGLGRLFPPLQPDDPEADAELRSLVRDDLEQGRREAMDRVRTTLAATEIDEGAAEAWLGVCNDLRLVLGTRLGVTGEEEAMPPDDDPDAWPTMVFHWLGWLVGHLVDALAGSLPSRS